MNFIELLETNIKEAYKLLTPKEGVEDYAKEFNNDRKVRAGQVGKREDKFTEDKVVPVAKITIPFQRTIVKSAASFLLGSKVELVPSEIGNGSSAIIKNWKDARIDSLLLEFCETVKSETEAALIFFPVTKAGNTKIKARLLTQKNGKLYPVFDEYGDMVAFGWAYVVKEGGKDVKYLHIWTDEYKYVFTGSGDNLVPVDTDARVKNEFKKIPVVYLSQEFPEWWEVQHLIDRFENCFSRFADTNDYFGHPMLKGKGALDVPIKKDKSGQMFELPVVETTKGTIIEADLEFLSWDRAPEALKMEFDTLRDLIFDMSNTADFSKLVSGGLGQLSGAAIKLMFFNSILKAKRDEGGYTVAILRILSVLQAGISNIGGVGSSPGLVGSIKNGISKVLGAGSKEADLSFDVRFTSPLPQNVKETVELLGDATGGRPIMSQATAVAHNPLVVDSKKELETMEAELNKDNLLDIGTSQQ